MSLVVSISEASQELEGGGRVEGPPTCQVSLQGGRGVLVPTVAAEEEEPDQERSQDQN